MAVNKNLVMRRFKYTWQYAGLVKIKLAALKVMLCIHLYSISHRIKCSDESELLTDSILTEGNAHILR